MGYAFISYSTKDRESAYTLRKVLTDYGIESWMAPGDIPAGSTYSGVITRAIRDAECLVLLLTNHSQDSVWVDKEVERALCYRKTIIPIALESIKLNDNFEFYLGNQQIVSGRQLDITKELLGILQRVRDLTKTDTERPLFADSGETSKAGDIPVLMADANKGDVNAQYELASLSMASNDELCEDKENRASSGDKRIRKSRNRESRNPFYQALKRAESNQTKILKRSAFVPNCIKLRGERSRIFIEEIGSKGINTLLDCSNMTVDLGGNELVLDCDRGLVISGCEVEFRNGTLIANGNEGVFVAGGQLILSNVSVHAKESAFLVIRSGSVVMNGTDVMSSNKSLPCIRLRDTGSSLAIKGSRITASATAVRLGPSTIMAVNEGEVSSVRSSEPSEIEMSNKTIYGPIEL